jgi:hypothetical protein
MASKTASVTMPCGANVVMKESDKGLAGAVKLVVRTFLEQKHYQELHSLLSEE